MLSLVSVSPVITAFYSCCLSHHVFDQVNLWPAWVGIETAIFWQCSPGTVETQRLYLLLLHVFLSSKVVFRNLMIDSSVLFCFYGNRCFYMVLVLFDSRICDWKFPVGVNCPRQSVISAFFLFFYKNAFSVFVSMCECWYMQIFSGFCFPPRNNLRSLVCNKTQSTTYLPPRVIRFVYVCVCVCVPMSVFLCMCVCC